MKHWMRFLMVCFVALFALSGAEAGQANSMQQKELKLLVEQMNKTIAAKSFDLMVNNLPSRLYKDLAKRMQTSEQALRQQLGQELQKQFENLPADAYRFNADAIEYRETAHGTFYALVPTHIETEVATVDSMTLFIYDEGQWHLVLGGQKTVQNPVFQELYPSFENVTFPLDQVVTK